MFILKNYPNSIVIIACFFWGSYWIPLRYLNNNSNESIWPICIAFIFLSLLLIKYLISSFYLVFIKKNYFFFFGCFFAALGIVLYSESLLRGEIAKAVVLFYLCPIWGTIFARIFFGKKLTTKRVLSILIGILGLEIMVGLEQGIFFPSLVVEWMALIAGFLWAIGTTFFHLASSSKSAEKTSMTTFIIPIVYLILCLFPESRNFSYSENLFNNTIYLWIVLFAIVWLLPSILLTFFSIEILDPGRINILLAFEVAVGFISAAILTNEIITIREYCGALLVITACFVDTIEIEQKH